MVYLEIILLCVSIAVLTAVSNENEEWKEKRSGVASRLFWCSFWLSASLACTGRGNIMNCQSGLTAENTKRLRNVRRRLWLLQSAIIWMSTMPCSWTMASRLAHHACSSGISIRRRLWPALMSCMGQVAAVRLNFRSSVISLEANAPHWDDFG